MEMDPIAVGFCFPFYSVSKVFICAKSLHWIEGYSFHREKGKYIIYDLRVRGRNGRPDLYMAER